MPQVINGLIMASVSLERIGSFLNANELSPYVTRHKDDTNAIEIRNGVNFSWEDGDNLTDSDKKTDDLQKNKENGSHSDTDLNRNAELNSENSSAFELKNINVSIRKGSLVAVVGGIGCGKSAFLSALLGEMRAYREDQQTPYVNISEELAFAYAPQQAWIQNASVRDNILFGRPYSERKYQQVLDACALRPDLITLPAEDKTEIGEKGINLSGGQKQRVSLARVCYTDPVRVSAFSSIYFLLIRVFFVDFYDKGSRFFR